MDTKKRHLSRGKPPSRWELGFWFITPTVVCRRLNRVSHLVEAVENREGGRAVRLTASWRQSDSRPRRPAYRFGGTPGTVICTCTQIYGAMHPHGCTFHSMLKFQLCSITAIGIPRPSRNSSDVRISWSITVRWRCNSFYFCYILLLPSWNSSDVMMRWSISFRHLSCKLYDWHRCYKAIIVLLSRNHLVASV